MAAHPQCGSDENRPAQHGLWSTVQAAVTGGWGSTFRLVLILAVIAAGIAALSLVGAAPISDFFK